MLLNGRCLYGGGSRLGIILLRVEDVTEHEAAAESLRDLAAGPGRSNRELQDFAPAAYRARKTTETATSSLTAGLGAAPNRPRG